MNRTRYSVVVPVYNEEECIEETSRRLLEVMDATGEPFELIFVNDGSRDRSAELIRGLCAADKRIKLIDFSRNFGHQIAVTAGLQHASGQAVVLIDADLQDPPEVILQMIDKWKQGYDVVYGKRIQRHGETLFKKASALFFYRLLHSMTNVNIPLDTGDFRLMDRKVCDALNGLKEQNRFIRGLVSWVGFKQTPVEYERQERFAGTTKYPLRKMVKFALDGITSFSYKPLRLASYLGFTVSAASFLYLLIVLYQKLFTTTTLPGWSSIVAVNLLFNGIVLIILGIIGEYIGRIYDESKNRPLYILNDKVGFGYEDNGTDSQD
ncbi:glycosyltransferase family 2 protein [Ferviditalea candida]|uniref:Glycosyltransferase family 2 protein n=1 Tax=Ferviditalea candida TaxID=3108399 RepID=A0ABU5ZKU3_9BACL|nr:glycosyltransferase family 2 protein [Paenibacillaceae bacterium T2]